MLRPGDVLGRHKPSPCRISASDEVKAAIKQIGINKCARESGFHRANFIRKLLRDMPVKRNSYNEFVRWLEANSMILNDVVPGQ